MEFKDRLRQAIKESGFSQREIARLMGVSPQAVSYWLNGRNPPERGKITKLSALLKKTPAWLEFGEGPKVISEGKSERGSAIPSVIISRDQVLKVKRFPLISWVQAGDWSEAIDLYEPGYAESLEPFTVEGRIGDHAFALRVRGDSMEPLFVEGDIILVDPGRSPNNGSFVIAKLMDTNECTFKKYVNDGGIISLHPLNYPKHQPIHLNGRKAQIVGVVIAKQQKFF